MSVKIKKYVDQENMMKKICFVTTVSMTLKAFVLDAAKYLHEKSDFDISFICDNDEQFAASLPEYIHYYPIPMERGISIGGFKAMWAIRGIFKEQKFDIVQYSTPNAACYASIAAWMAKVPVRLYCQWGIAYVGFTGVKRAIFKLEEKMVCKLSTWIEPDSFGNLSFSHAEGLYPENKGSVIWNGSASGVNLKKFDVSQKAEWREKIREQYNILEDAKVFIFIGRVTRDKGINELFYATKQLFEQYKDTYLLMVGPNENSGSVDQALYDWSVKEKRVIYCGFSAEVEKYLAASDVYVLPSYREGFGSAVVEAEAMQLPVIVNNIPGPTDAMQENVTGLIVEKGNAEELLTAMKRLYSDKDLREDLAKNAHTFAAEKFEQLTLFEKMRLDREQLMHNQG